LSSEVFIRGFISSLPQRAWDKKALLLLLLLLLYWICVSSQHPNLSVLQCLGTDI
jgi:hypothetical protein